MYDVITHPLTHVQIPSMTLSLPENLTSLQKAHFLKINSKPTSIMYECELI